VSTAVANLPVTLRSVDEVVDYLWEKVNAGVVSAFSEAVAMFYEDLDIDEETRAVFERKGVISEGNNQQHHRRIGDRPIVRYGAPQPREWQDYLATLSLVREGAENVSKPALDFEEADWHAYVTRCAGQRKGWEERENVGRDFIAALRAAKKSKTSELPEAVLKSLAERLAKVGG
jgi:hypothetical protein